MNVVEHLSPLLFYCSSFHFFCFFFLLFFLSIFTRLFHLHLLFMYQQIVLCCLVITKYYKTCGIHFLAKYEGKNQQNCRGSSYQTRWKKFDPHEATKQKEQNDNKDETTRNKNKVQFEHFVSFFLLVMFLSIIAVFIFIYEPH